MDPEEIAVVLSRASELHSKLSDSIERVMKSEFLLVRRSPNSAPSLDALPPLPPGNQTNDGDTTLRSDLQNGDRPGDGTVEVRSLASIRDALEVLEEQLEALQALQQQQRAERDAGLAEIEESRRVLLRRLKEHRGRELEIVQEALAFAGETVSDKEDLPLPPYPRVLDDGQPPQIRPVSIPSRESRPGRRSGMVEEQQDRSEVLDSEVDEQEDDEGSDGELGFQYEEEREPENLIGLAVDAVKNSGVIEFAANAVKSSVALLGHITGKITGQVTGPSSKVLLIVVSTLAVLSLTDLGQRRGRKKTVSRVSKTPAHRSAHHPIGENPPVSIQHSQHPQNEKSPAHAEHTHHATYECAHNSASGKSSANEEKSTQNSSQVKMEDEFPKCVVRERLELPFYQELRTPDVLYGRG